MFKSDVDYRDDKNDWTMVKLRKWWIYKYCQGARSYGGLADGGQMKPGGRRRSKPKARERREKLKFSAAREHPFL